MKMETQYLYVVRQTQPSSDYELQTIAIYDDYDNAVELARKLNKEYGNTKTCEFNEDWDFVDVLPDIDDITDLHYYDVSSICYNEPFETFGV